MATWWYYRNGYMDTCSEVSSSDLVALFRSERRTNSTNPDHVGFLADLAPPNGGVAVKTAQTGLGICDWSFGC